MDASQTEALAAMREKFQGADGHGLILDDPCLLRYLRRATRGHELPKSDLPRLRRHHCRDELVVVINY
jgi:hypothetical protein